MELGAIAFYASVLFALYVLAVVTLAKGLSRGDRGILFVLGFSAIFILSEVNIVGFQVLPFFGVQPRVLKTGERGLITVYGPGAFPSDVDLKVFGGVSRRVLPDIQVFDYDSKEVFGRSEIVLSGPIVEMPIVRREGRKLLVSIPEGLKSGLIVVEARGVSPSWFRGQEDVFVTDRRTGYLEVRE